MQSALDAIALSLIKTANQTSSALSSAATSTFKANFNRPEAQSVQITAAYNSSSGTLTLNGSASLPTNFLEILGKSSLP